MLLYSVGQTVKQAQSGAGARTLTDPNSFVQRLLVIKMTVGDNDAVKDLDGADRPFYRQFQQLLQNVLE